MTIGELQIQGRATVRGLAPSKLCPLVTLHFCHPPQLGKSFPPTHQECPSVCWWLSPEGTIHLAWLPWVAFVPSCLGHHSTGLPCCSLLLFLLLKIWLS